MSDDTTSTDPDYEYKKNLQYTRPNRIYYGKSLEEKQAAKDNEYKTLVYETKDELNKRIDLLQYEIHNLNNHLIDLKAKIQ